MNKNVWTRCQATLDDGEIAKPTKNCAPFSFKQKESGKKNTSNRKYYSLLATVTPSSDLPVFHFIFLFRFVCGAHFFFTEACHSGIKNTYCYISPFRVSASLSRATSFLFHLRFSLEHTVTIDFHVKFCVISYHSFNFFIFSNRMHSHSLSLFISLFFRYHSWNIWGGAFNFSPTYSHEFSTPHSINSNTLCCCRL